MFILAIDPGTATTGFALLRANKESLEAVDYGVISTDKDLPVCNRLEIIYDSIRALAIKYEPDCLIAEQLFFNTNSKTAISVGQARGAVMLAAKKSDLEFYEYTPLQVKQAVCGYGRADKHQVGTMVKMLLRLEEIPRPDDAADALALGICHANNDAQGVRVTGNGSRGTGHGVRVTGEEGQMTGEEGRVTSR